MCVLNGLMSLLEKIRKEENDNSPEHQGRSPLARALCGMSPEPGLQRSRETDTFRAPTAFNLGNFGIASAGLALVTHGSCVLGWGDGRVQAGGS